jgi:3D (Asp-Asp-Asp) domain-containing protein
MEINQKNAFLGLILIKFFLLNNPKKVKIYVLALLFTLVFGGVILFWEFRADSAQANLLLENTLTQEPDKLLIFQGNSLLAKANHFNGPENHARRLEVIVTAYSSTPWETDSTPFITASGAVVEDGVIANNILEFGTKVRIPELFGEKIFIVKDRMNSRKDNYYIDIWFPSYWEALNFGVKRTYIEIVEG